MVHKPNETLIGLFLLTGLTVFIFVLAMYFKNFFHIDNENIVVMYFQESVKGLNIGSPVVFRGVEIGKVSEIDIEADMKNLTFSIPVYVNFDESKTFISKIHKQNRKDILDALIKKGLRARLSTQNYLTGQLFVELIMQPNSPVILEKNTKNIYQIPTILSPLSELSKGLQNISFKEVTDKLSQMIDTLNNQIPVVLPEIAAAAAKFNQMLSNNTRLTTEALSNFNRTIIEVGSAARSIDNLTSYLERHPEALLRGKGE